MDTGRMVKRFVGKDTLLGKRILLNPGLAKYRPWLGKMVLVNTESARYGEGIGDIVVDITDLDRRMTLEGVRIAVLTKANLKDDGPDFAIAEQEELRKIAEDKKAAITKGAQPAETTTAATA